MIDSSSAHAAELRHFGALAARWWDPNGPSKALIALNPIRTQFVNELTHVEGKHVADIGCGGGLLSEALARLGAKVSGLDLSAELIDVARLHAIESALDIDYQCVEAGAFAQQHVGFFDVVTCMEMLEHVPDPRAIIAAAATMLKPGGWLIASTLNRTLKAFALAIVGGEYVTGLVPRGTHRFDQFIKPNELASAMRACGLQVKALKGLQYRLLNNSAHLTDDYEVNYLIAAQKV
jgi:2-polyprenyl-6-hydroxyphenyl methylase / 3-demethylubiquinone-9 3-methyltransferase